jgi:hypothetical protein
MDLSAQRRPRPVRVQGFSNKGRAECVVGTIARLPRTGYRDNGFTVASEWGTLQASSRTTDGGYTLRTVRHYTWFMKPNGHLSDHG